MTKSSKEKKIEPPPPIDTEPLKNEVNAKQDGKNSKSRSKEKRGDDGKNPTGAAESRGDKEERRSKVLFQPKIMTEEEFRKDLLAWVKSVPLSDTSFTKIDRAFSDGVLLVEVIRHFDPDICEKWPYIRSHSKANKAKYWEFINRLLFPKLGFRLKPGQIDYICRPFGCGKFQPPNQCADHGLIYKVLDRVRKALAAKGHPVFDYREASFQPPKQEKKKYMRPLGNALYKPMYSKAELQLTKGWYDCDSIWERYRHKAWCPCEPCCPAYNENCPEPPCCRIQSCASCACRQPSCDWVEFIPQHRSCISFCP